MVAFPLFVQSNGPLIVFFMLFYEIHILVHSITHSLIIVSSYNLIGMCIRYRRRVPCKNECPLFLVSKLCPFDSFSAKIIVQPMTQYPFGILHGIL